MGLLLQARVLHAAAGAQEERKALLARARAIATRLEGGELAGRVARAEAAP